jgi:hypothetical protein
MSYFEDALHKKLQDCPQHIARLRAHSKVLEERGGGMVLESLQYAIGILHDLELVRCLCDKKCRLCQGEPMAEWPPGPGKGPTHHTCHPGHEKHIVKP